MASMKAVEECGSSQVALQYDAVGIFNRGNSEELSSILKQFVQ